MAKRGNAGEHGGVGKKSRLQVSSRKVDRKRKRKADKEKKNSKTRRRTGPRLPNSLKRELGLLDPKTQESDNESGSDHNDPYEYEDGVPEEETKKNRRYDAVDNLEYELPEDFKDEDVKSDDDDVFGGDDGDDNDNDDYGDGGNHARMLHGITGIPVEAFEVKGSKEPILMDSSDMNGNDAKISIHDLLDPLHGKKGFSELRKKVNQMDKKSMLLNAPIPKVQRAMIERKVAYNHSKKDITKWEPLVKRNREAPTIYFEEDRNVGFSTVGAIASEFQPRTEFEKKMASLVNDPNVVEAYETDGMKLLELNKVSIEDVRKRQNSLAKMRSLLFHHEMKQKRIKNIKSKTYHRMLKKDKTKVALAEVSMDPEAIREQTLKQEFKRAEERLTLKHKNKSKWAQRNLKRGLKAQDEGTRAAMAEQLHQHELLTRKMDTMRDSSDEDTSSEDDENEDDLSPQTDKNTAQRLLTRAKDKTAEIIEEEEEIPKSGVLSLPFMVRGLKKKKDAVDEEARLALEEYDRKLGNLQDASDTGIVELGTSGGRKVFGALKEDNKVLSKKVKRENIYNSSDSEAEFDMKNGKDEDGLENNGISIIKVEAELHKEEQKIRQETAVQDLDENITNTNPKSTYEVAMFASGSWKKVNSEKPLASITETTSGGADAALPVQAPDDENGMESDQDIVDEFMSSGAKPEYELPSQDDLIRRAFAGDDVDLEFEKEKMEVFNEENPEPEKPVLLPGWGQWTDVQQKKGLPSWMVKEHEYAKKKREEALGRRKDAHLKHVIISEKTDKKAEKLHTKKLPFPFTSKEVFEQSIRMPIGPDFNPAISVGALNRPTVVKESGIIIKPIKFEEVNTTENVESKQGEQKRKTKKGKEANDNIFSRKK